MNFPIILNNNFTFYILLIFSVIVFNKFKIINAYPFFILIIIIFQNLLSISISLFGIGDINLLDIFIFFFFIYFFIKVGISEKLEYFILIMLFMFIISIFYYQIFIYKHPYNTFVINSRYILIQISMLTSFLYCKKYGSKKIYTAIYIGFIIYIVHVFYRAILFQELYFHDAYKAFAVSFIVLYIYIILKHRMNRFFKFLIIVITLTFGTLPFLGMVRGGIIAVLGSFFIVSLYIFRNKKNLLFLPIILFIITMIVYLKVSPKLQYYHRSQENLFDLYNYTIIEERTENVRTERWSDALRTFTTDYFMGIGYFSKIPYMRWPVIFLHNYFIAFLVGGGLLVFIPILLIYTITIYKIFKIYFSLKKTDYIFFFAIGLFFNVININMTNTYFASRISGTIIWIIFGCSLYEINNYYNKMINK